MALIETELPPEAMDDQWGKLSPDAALTLRFPGKEPLQARPSSMCLSTCHARNHDQEGLVLSSPAIEQSRLQ